jgi:hypothetical protein
MGQPSHFSRGQEPADIASVAPASSFDDVNQPADRSKHSGSDDYQEVLGMPVLSNAHHFRKMVAGVCMMLAPLLLLVSAIIHPGLKTDEAALLASAARNPDAWYLAVMLALVSIVLAVPATLGLMHMLRERHAAAGHVGGGLALIGLLAFTGVTAIHLVVWQMARPGLDRVQMVSLLRDVDNATGIFIPFYLCTFAFALGYLVLAYGLAAARAISPVMAGCIAIGAVLLSVGYATAVMWLFILAAALLLIGLGSTGLAVLRETDAEWEHTPRFRGFRAAPGTQ